MPVALMHFLCLIEFLDYDESGLMHWPKTIKKPNKTIEVNSAARASLVT